MRGRVAIVDRSRSSDRARDAIARSAGDVIKAARLLQTSRLDDARAVLAELEKRAPDSAEVKWLEAELAFQTGDYAGAVKLLDKLPDDGGRRAGRPDAASSRRRRCR